MITVNNLHHEYNGAPVLRCVTFTAEEGDRIHLCGPSGVGKTTLLNVLAGLITPSSGTAKIEGTVAYQFQEPRLLPWLTAEENVAFVLPRGADPDLARKYLSAVELWEARGKKPSELSGGMCRRVALARTLAYAEAPEAAVLLLDEPLTGVDDEAKSRLYHHILQAADGKLLILSTHDGQEAAALCNRTLTLTAENGAQITKKIS